MQISFTVEKRLAVLSSSGESSKELTVVSWNGNPAKLDLRTWRTVDGEQRPGKGLTLNRKEAAELASALNKYLEGA